MQLATVLMVLAVALPVPAPAPEWLQHWPADDGSVHILVDGRFAEGGRRATLEIVRPSPEQQVPTKARVLTDRCRNQVSTLQQAFPSQDAPLAVVDLDGDGRDEVFLLDRGNNIHYVMVLRVDGCHVDQVWKEGSPSDEGMLPFGGHGVMGISCRRTSSGSVDVLQIAHWAQLKATDPEHPSAKPDYQVGWTRTTFVVRGDRLVKTGEDHGTSARDDDPSVPLIDSFECLGGIIYP